MIANATQKVIIDNDLNVHTERRKKAVILATGIKIAYETPGTPDDRAEVLIDLADKFLKDSWEAGFNTGFTRKTEPVH